MRKLFWLTAILLLSSAWVVAQNASQAGSSNPSQSSSTTSETTIGGCLSGSAGNYTLTDSSGKTYQLQGDTSKFSDQVGHQVRIMGSEMGASASATTPSGASASANTSSSGTKPPSSSTTNPSSTAASPAGSASAAIQFNVTKVEKVSDTCSAPPMSK